jgi:hypothetical protein
LKYKELLGYPYTEKPITTNDAEQPNQNGHSFWVENPDRFFFTSDRDHKWVSFAGPESPWKTGMPNDGVCTITGSPTGIVPVRGFRGFWCLNPKITDTLNLKDMLGWPTAAELSFRAKIQKFGKGGWIFQDSDGQTKNLIYIFFPNGTFVREAP